MNSIIASLKTTKDKLNLLDYDRRHISNDTITTDIVDNDITTALEKLSILLDKSSSNDVPNKASQNLSNDTTDIFKPLIISAIETIAGISKRPDINAIYSHISSQRPQM